MKTIDAEEQGHLYRLRHLLHDKITVNENGDLIVLVGDLNYSHEADQEVIMEYFWLKDIVWGLYGKE